MRRSTFRAVIVAALCPVAGAKATTLVSVAVSGQQAPGEPTGYTYSSFFNSSFQIDNAGFLTFSASLAPPSSGSPFVNVLYTGTQAALQPLLQDGSAAPGYSAGTTVGVPDTDLPALNQAGQVTFLTELHGVSGEQYVNYFYPSDTNSIAIVSHTGDPAPDTSTTYGVPNFSGYCINSNGEVAFNASLNPNSSQQALFLGAPGDVHLVAQQGAQAADFSSGVTYASVQSNQTLGNGGVGFEVGLTGTGITSGKNSNAIYAGRSGNLTLIAQQGSSLPGQSWTIGSMDAPMVNASGNVVFEAEDSSLSHSAISYGSLNNPMPVLTTGEAAPGIPGATFAIFGQPALTDSGEMVFGASLSGTGITGSNNRALFVGTPAAPQLVWQNGTQAPGFASGVTLGAVLYPQGFGGQELAVNDNGQVAFNATLTGPGFNSLDGDSIWATLPDGTITLVARDGETLTVDGQTKTIQDVMFASGASSLGYGTAFTDNGQIPLQLTFTDDSSALFIATVPVPVPEPTSLAAIVLTTGFLVQRRRKHN